MRMRERGIGNLPFIAVLVLFIIAVALYFMAQDQADTFEKEARTARAQVNEADKKLLDAREAYDAMKEMWGPVTGIEQLARDVDKYPNPDEIKAKLRDYMEQVRKDLRERGVARIQNNQYQPNSETNAVEVIKGEMTQILLFASPLAKEMLTVKGLLDPMPTQLAWAAKAIEENNQQFESEYSNNLQSKAEMKNTISSSQSTYDSDVATKQASIDSLTTEKNDLQDSTNNLTAQLDSQQSQRSEAEQQLKAAKRDWTRKEQAYQDRIKAEIVKKELALKEDPKDGEVVVADSRMGLVYINLGRRNKVANGTKFTVWRPGKGNVRENVAVIRVIKVDLSRSQARIIDLLNPRAPVTAGMNISNPFYDPFEQLRVFVYGDLRHYPTEVAKRRLAKAGVSVSPILDDTVRVIVLGDPPVTVEEAEDPDDAGAAALAERRASIERDKRLNEILERAKAVGAIVVTEDVLRTFIDY